jgi:hypothetical protein
MSETLESGEIFFFYRPRVREDDGSEQVVRGIDDVERYYVVLHSVGRHVFRRVMLRKHREQLTGIVDEVTPAPEDFADALLRGAYSGAVSRPAGEGTYTITRSGDQLRLEYRLLLPEKPGALQRALQIETVGAFILSVTHEAFDHEGTRLTLTTESAPIVEATV